MAQITLKTDMLSTQVYHLLKKEILRHEILPGERLIDAALAKKYGISRTPVRDALFMLIKDGIVENRGRQGFVVWRADRRALDELYDFRLLIEKKAIEKIVLRMDEGENLEPEFNKIEEKMNSEYEKGNTILSDEIFHRGLVSFLDNSIICNTYDELNVQIHLCREEAMEVESRVSNGKWFHDQIMDALHMQNGARADRLLSDHIEKERQDMESDGYFEMM